MFSKETEPTGDYLSTHLSTYREIYYKEWAHMITKCKMSQDLTWQARDPNELSPSPKA